MASLWWQWGRRSITQISPAQSIAAVYNAIIVGLGKDNGYSDVRVQNSGDLYALKKGIPVAVKYLQIGANSYWQVMACGGASKADSERIFDDIQAIVNKVIP